MWLPHISLIAAFFTRSSKMTCIIHIFPHKLAFSTSILILFVFLLPVSIRFRYLNHLATDRMAPSMCPVPCVVVGFKQFCTIFPPQIWCVCSLHILKKCRINWHAWLESEKSKRKSGNVTSAGWQVTLCDPIWYWVPTVVWQLDLLLT